MFLRVLCSILAAPLLMPKLAFCQATQTEPAAIVPAMWVQVEMGGTFQRQGDTRRWTHPEALGRYGLGSGVELRMAAVIESEHRGSEGWSTSGGAAQIGAKLRLTSEHGLLPESALLAHLGVPMGGGGTAIPAEIRFAFSHMITEQLSLDYNVGSTWEDLRSRGVLLYTALVGLGLTERLSLFVETFGSASRGTSEADANAGLTFLLAPNVQLDVAIGHSIMGGEPRAFAGAGISFRLPR